MDICVIFVSIVNHYLETFFTILHFKKTKKPFDDAHQT
jgi:hypothetical protein